MAEIYAKLKKFNFVTPVMNHINKTIIREEIQWLLEAISEQFEAIASYENKIPQIEFDIILENIRKLYENLHLLNRINDPVATRVQSMKEAREVKPAVPAGKENNPPEIRKEKPAGRPTVKIRIESESKDETGDTNRKSQPDQDEIDLFSVLNSGFTERLKEAREKSHRPEKHSSREDELKSMISINEKFLFINELFDGNLREYNLMIETLNNSADLKSALEYLDLLRKKNLWESESPAFKRIKELVEQRF